MARFHNLTVTDIHHTIRDAVVLTLEPEEAGAAWAFIAAFIDFASCP